MLRRAGLGLVALAQAEVGVWGEASPHGFFTRFPGLFGQHWVAAFGPYDEHLVRDFAAAELGFAVLLVACAIWLERRLVLVAGSSFLVFTLAHFAFHLSDTSPLSSSSDALSLGAFVLEMLIVAGVMVSMTTASRPETTRRTHAPPATGNPART
jgi:hypothetical protein